MRQAPFWTLLSALRASGSRDGRYLERVRARNQGVIISLAAEIERVRADDEFTARAKKLLERDKEILDRLAK